MNRCEVTEPRNRPILFALFGLNRAGQILWAAAFILGFLYWTDVLTPHPFSSQDEQLFRAARHGDRAGVERALGDGASLTDTAPVDRKTALFRAARAI